MDDFFEVCGNLIFFSGTMIIGVTIASFFISQTMHNEEINITEEEVEEEEEEPDFMTLYSLEDKEIRELSSAEKEALKIKHCKVETPAGEVLMSYEDPYFMYYAKNGSIIPYRFLDVVARKFVLDHDCVVLYKKLEVIKKEEEKKDEEKKEEEKKDEEKKDEEKKETSVFVKKKKPVTKKNIVTKTMNKFKYRGQISEYDDKPKEEREEPKKMTFSDYKQFMSNQ